MSFPYDVLDPDIKRFREAESDGQRAHALLGASVLTLLRWHDVFMRFSDAVGFADGVSYLDALSACLKARRHRGNIGTTDLDAARQRLLNRVDRAAEGRASDRTPGDVSPARPEGQPPAGGGAAREAGEEEPDHG